MRPRPVIAVAESEAELEAVRELFRAYAGSLAFDLGFQDFEAEMVEFPGKYAPPTGVLLLARLEEMAAGAVGLRDLGDGICEMKRLYVRPEARGHAIGRRLAERLIDEACSRGYRAMRLDTVPGHHDHAMALYRELGFQEIAPYCYNPVPGALFMELAL
jgi:ribosomal protein S18 acetylase RimI-like enzyme